MALRETELIEVLLFFGDKESAVAAALCRRTPYIEGLACDPISM